MIVIGVKFCGGCNPLIDRGKIYKQLKKELPAEYELNLDSNKPWDIGLLLSGCPNACCDNSEIRSLASRWVLISGAMLDHIAIEELLLVGAVIKKVQAMMVLQQNK